MKYLSTFSGIGGFELGIQQAYDMDNRRTTETSTLEERWDKPMSNYSDGNGRRTNPTCIGFSEIDKYAAEIYQRHFPNHKNYGDITAINAEELPDFDLLVGGFPCQAFSIAGKRGGFEDTRGTMFFELARILKAKQPRLFVFENVKGLLSHDGGKSFSTIIQTLDELGYDCQWQVLNSKNHGVPQNRERVFIIGHLRGTSRPEVFPFGESNGLNNGEAPQGNDLAYCLQAGNDKHRGSYVVDDSFKSRPPRVYKETAPTVRNYGGGGGLMPIVMPAIRRLTPTECERLQGFPDGWTEGVSDTQRYKTLGNAVTVNVIQDIFEKILQS
jgi:DNA (cytosine-5)-methyltransferase 1